MSLYRCVDCGLKSDEYAMMDLSVDIYIEMVNDFQKHLDVIEARSTNINLIHQEEESYEM